MKRAVFASIFSAAVWAQSPAPPAASGAPSQDLTSLDLAALLNMKVTTASRFAEDISGAPGIMSVVTSDELRRFGGMTLGEILQRVPGLTGSSQNFTDRSLVSARGDQTTTDGGHILFLINGRPTREVMEGGIITDLLESFPVDILERIEVIKGPGSVLYGSNAFSAVINLITRKAEGTEASASALGGAGSALDSAGHFMYRRGDFNAVASAQMHDAPDVGLTYRVPPSQPNVPTAPRVARVQDASVIDRGAGGYLGLNYKNLSFMSTVTEAEATSFVQGTVGETRLTRQFGDLGYHASVGAKWDMNFNVTVTRTSFGVVQYPSIRRDSNELVAEWSNVITLTRKDRLTAGALFNRIQGAETIVTPIGRNVDAKGNRPGGAFFAQIEHRFRDDLKVIAGVQTNKIGSIPLDTVPRAGMIWTPAHWVSLKALYGKAFRAPSLDEMLIAHPGLRGNPDLLPEKVGTFDLGAGFKGGKFEIGFDYFHSVQTDAITAVTQKTFAQYVNIGRLTFDGGEMEGKYYFAKNFFGQGSMLYQTNINSTGQMNVTPLPNLSFKAGVSYENRRGLTLGLFNLSDGPINPYPGSVNPVQGAHNVLNANFRYDLSKYLPVGDRQRIAVVAHANNLTNRQEWLPGWGFNSIDSIPVQQGRVIYAGLEFSAGRN